MEKRVCTFCIGDDDLKAWIKLQAGPSRCDYCSNRRSPTVTISKLCKHMESCLPNYWGLAVEQLPYNTREGGYLGTTYDTQDIIFDEIGLHLPRDDSGKLHEAIAWSLSDEIWCDYEWMRLDEDEAMISSWDRFCEVVKHERRFFFQSSIEDSEESFSPESILGTIAAFSQTHGLLVELDAGTKLYRARPNFNKRNPVAADFGPPPKDVSQSNRMNPAGISMFYGALDSKTAVREVKSQSAKVGCFTTARPLRVLDLTRLPKEPGCFSPSGRRRTMELSFLNHFATNIMQPVERDDRVHTEYVPSQVVTEFLRDFDYEEGKIDGIMYGSVVSPKRKNVVLFIDTLTPKTSIYMHTPLPMISFIQSKRVNLAEGKK